MEVYVQKNYYLETLPGRYLPLEAEGAAWDPQVRAVVEKSRDLMGSLRAVTLGYENRLSLGPIYAGPGGGLYSHLRWILDRGLVMDRLRTSLLEVLPDGRALRREACIEITDAREGKLAFTLHFTGRSNRGHFREGKFHGTYF